MVKHGKTTQTNHVWKILGVPKFETSPCPLILGDGQVIWHQEFINIVLPLCIAVWKFKRPRHTSYKFIYIYICIIYMYYIYIRIYKWIYFMCAFIVRNIFDEIQPSTGGECFPHKNAVSHAEGTVLTQ